MENAFLNDWQYLFLRRSFQRQPTLWRSLMSHISFRVRLVTTRMHASTSWKVCVFHEGVDWGGCGEGVEGDDGDKPWAWSSQPCDHYQAMEQVILIILILVLIIKSNIICRSRYLWLSSGQVEGTFTWVQLSTSNMETLCRGMINLIWLINIFIYDLIWLIANIAIVWKAQ